MGDIFPEQNRDDNIAEQQQYTTIHIANFTKTAIISYFVKNK